ncbi:sugar O-acyltransferase, sialic acid O-acetyltransferase NeuD family [Rhodobacteraceae bacterium HIMB11]|nr:sugar O-acyltransferase, sialic acid O-acetyltransferase NeuD family [Rhodobacteraceae bacterium HIMB11]
MTDIVIIGAGETARMAKHYFEQNKEQNIIYYVDENIEEDSEFLGRPLLTENSFQNLCKPHEVKLFIAIGSEKLNTSRERLFVKYSELGFDFANCLSKDCIIPDDVILGSNVFIQELNNIQSGCSIGDNTIIWAKNHIGHNSQIGRNCFITSGVTISGNVTIGDNCFLGVNCAVADEIVVDSHCFIGMGAMIMKDVPHNTLISSNKPVTAQISAKRFCRC